MKVSVYITSYNQREYLQQAFQSVQAQTRPPDEIVVVDDASTDRSQELIASWQRRWPSLVKAVLRTQNGGVVAARNDALAHISGDVMSFVDGDDFWREDKLALELEALGRSTQANWVYSIPIIVNARGVPVRPMVRPFDGASGHILFEALSHDLSLRDWTAEMDVVRAVGKFDPSLEILEDWDFKIRMAARASIAWIPQATIFYRRHGSGLSDSPSWTYFSNLMRIYQKHAPLISSLPKAEQDKVLARKNSDLRRFFARALFESTPAKHRRLLQKLRNSLSTVLS